MNTIKKNTNVKYNFQLFNKLDFPTVVTSSRLVSHLQNRSIQRERCKWNLLLMKEGEGNLLAKKKFFFNSG